MIFYYKVCESSPYTDFFSVEPMKDDDIVLLNCRYSADDGDVIPLREINANYLHRMISREFGIWYELARYIRLR